MTVWRRFLATVYAVALVTGGAACAGGPQGIGFGPDRIEQQALDALERWDAAVAAAGGDRQRAFIPVDRLTDQVGNWELETGDNNKPALISGEFEAAVALPTNTPPDAEISWPDGATRKVPVLSATAALDAARVAGNHDCPQCRPLRVTAARLTIGSIRTSRGVATVPVWEYTLDGTAVKVTQVAIAKASAITVTPPSWDPYNAPGGIWIESAKVSADDRRLTVAFTGSPGTAAEPCGADYTGRSVESANAVVVIVDERRHAANEMCTAIGAMRTTTVELAQPLGDRAVLEVVQGTPVPVTAEG